MRNIFQHFSCIDVNYSCLLLKMISLALPNLKQFVFLPSECLKHQLYIRA